MRTRNRMLWTAAGWVALLGPVVLLGPSPAVAAPAAATTAPSPPTAWAPAALPEPTGAFSGTLLGSSCVSATDCAAVGWGSTTGSPIGTLVENWDGSEWTPVNSPDPSAPGDAFPQLNGVSCLPTGQCTAVGTDLTTSNGSNTVVESSDGTSWSVVRAPTRPVRSTAH